MEKRSETSPAPEPFGRVKLQLSVGFAAFGPLMYWTLPGLAPVTGSTALNEPSRLPDRSTENWFMTSWMVSEPTAANWIVGSAAAGPAWASAMKPAVPTVTALTATRVVSLAHGWDLSLIEMPLHLDRGRTLYGR